MLFSSFIFLFLFLPLVVLLALIRNARIQNYFLLAASLIFYAWGGVSYTIIIIISIVMNYLLGICIEKFNGLDKILVTTGVILNLGILAFFKYLNLLVDTFNEIVPEKNALNISYVALPIGISFFTFHGLSYIIDVYRKKFAAQKDFSILALYITLFPQLIAGPIIRYKDIYKQFLERKNTVTGFSYGIKRFIIGLGKKIILANTFAAIADKIFALDPALMSSQVAWLGIISYTIQIYFDFSGYSDMAIGIGHMFGFRFPENFNLPYISRSIQEFWRRWHISLSTWFRDYLYIPMGGNKVSRAKTFRNLITVFFLCGLWHGASWTFVIWGLYHGFFLGIERIGWKKIVDRFWKPLRHLYTMLVVMVGWVFFRADNFNDAVAFIGRMFSLPDAAGYNNAVEYLNPEIIFYLLLAIFYSTDIPKRLYRIIKKRMMFLPSQSRKGIQLSQFILSSVVLIGIFFLCSFYLATSSYNPFIYFRF
jgi:alginate O-acetyltransferase complex protein AlgI